MGSCDFSLGELVDCAESAVRETSIHDAQRAGKSPAAGHGSRATTARERVPPATTSGSGGIDAAFVFRNVLRSRSSSISRLRPRGMMHTLGGVLTAPDEA